MILSTQEAADLLGVSARYVRKLIEDNRIDGYKIGTTWVIIPGPDGLTVRPPARGRGRPASPKIGSS